MFWRNSEQLQGDLVETVAALENDPTIRRIALSGSVSVVRQLLDAALLDELHRVRPPGHCGVGTEALRGGWARSARRADLVAGVQHRLVYLVYAPDPDPPTGSYDEARESLPQE